VDVAAESFDRTALMREALAGLQSGAFARTEAACAALLAADPGDIEALLLQGLALAAARRPADAAGVLNHVALARPGFAHPCADLGGLLDAPGYAAQVRACLALTPQDTRLRLLWADNRHAQGDLDEAETTLATLLRDQPTNAAAQHRLGLVRAEQGDFDGAIARMLRAVTLDPAPALGWANLGMLLKVQGRFDEALEAYDEALAQAPDDARIRVNRVVALLQAGRFAEAWPDHEWRFTLAGAAGLPRERRLPALATRPALEGRTVLLTHEAGFGDTLQFCRYVPLLAALGARVVLAVPAELQRLLRGLAGVAELVPADAALPEYDWHCPMMSLPGVFGTIVETIPTEVPYLAADPALVELWRARLPKDDAFRVGLVWAGQARPWLPGFATVDGRRSMHFEQLAPLGAVAGVRFVSLQAYPSPRVMAGPRVGPEARPRAGSGRPPTTYLRECSEVVGGRAKPGHDTGEGGATPGLTLIDPMADVTDFADTAAIIANLDLVIGVDTSVIHLAGALGKPVFMLDRYDNCWRWLHGRDDSPWYPTLRIFRQTQIGDWEPVVRQAAKTLRTLAGRAG
jgi:thioredoxin-like negative regulator of GroEL